MEELKGKVVEQVSCSRSSKYCQTGCVDSDGFVYTWGSGAKGKLGHAETWTHANPADEKVPKRVEFLKDAKARAVVCGGLHTGVVTVDGVLYTFGCGSDGRLGHVKSGMHKVLYKQAVPKIVETFKGKFIEAVASSYYHMIAIVH